ncbi:hypothetical protein [Streptomyces sp. ME18-1-4]|uniref:hypothetical protein n=1 Tax=Streptomyces sp. ME18-1-4 TaxID=3028685 RepID=UPI0039F6DF7D
MSSAMRETYPVPSPTTYAGRPSGVVQGSRRGAEWVIPTLPADSRGTPRRRSPAPSEAARAGPGPGPVWSGRSAAAAAREVGGRECGGT